MTQFEIDSFATASGGGGGVVSGAYQLSGIYQVSGDYAFDFAKQVSGLYVTHSGGFYAASGTAGGGGTVSGWAQASGFYVEHSGGLYQPSGVYVGASGGLYQASGIFQTSGVFQTSGIYQVSGDYPLAHTKQASGIYLLTSGGLYQVSGVFALSGTTGGGGTSGFIHAGTFLGSGNSSTLLYTLSHGLGQVPDGISVDAASPQARGDIDISGNASGIFVTYTNPPLSGDVKLSWVAGPSASAGGIVSGLFALSGTGGLGGVSGVVHAATFLGSGNNSTSVYTLSHGLGTIPKGISVEAGSPAARGSFDVSGDASNIYVKYPVAPVSGDVRLSWIAGPTDVVNLVMGSGWVHAATFLGSGDNSTKLYTLSHGLERIPTGISVQAASPQARGDYDVSGNASGIYVTYTSPPLSGDVKLSWVAGPSTISNIVTLGSGTVHAATFLGSGNASTTTYTLSHGIGAAPQGLVVSPMSPNARGDFDVSGNASGIFVTYPVAPASGDVKLSWMAGPSTLVTISGNLVHGGEFIGSGNNSTTQYTLSHGLGLVPTTVIVKEGSPQARGLYDVSGNASGLFVTYTSPPASGTVRLFWQAGPSSIAVINAQSGIYTITSGSSINGVISGTPIFAGNASFSGNITFAKNIGLPYTVGIFKRGSTVYAQDYRGVIVASGIAGIGTSSGGDDHAVISSGIAYVPIGVGGSVFFADPPFYVERPILLKDYVRLYSTSDRITNDLSGATFVPSAGLLSGEPMMYDTNFQSGSLTAVRLEGLSFNGLDDLRDGVKAAFDRSTISNCNFEDCRNAINITRAGAFTNEGDVIYGCRILRGERAIITDSPAFTVQNCIIGRMGKDCIQHEGYSLKVIGCKIYEASMSGTGFALIQATDANYSTIIGNDIDTDISTSNAVTFFDADYTVSEGNRVKGSIRQGFQYNSGSNYNLCLGNVISASGGTAGIVAFQEQSGSSHNFFLWNIFTNEAGFPGGRYVLRSDTSMVIDASGMMIGAGAVGGFTTSGKYIFSNVVNYNASGAISANASGISGTFFSGINPRGFYVMQISGVDRKVPFFD